jgi:signal transduction histidine kinase
LVLGNRSGLQIHAVDRECVWFKRRGSNWQGVLVACWDSALDLETEPGKWRLLRATLGSRKPFRDFVYRSTGGNGIAMYVKASGKPVFGPHGQFLGYRGTGADVTAIKRAQEEHERLRQLESDLAHMNRLSMMGELAASLAHEITQPIAAARNNARAALNFLSKQTPDLGEVREALGCVVGDANRAGLIVDRIRDHIKKAPPRKQLFDLNEAIGEVVGSKRDCQKWSFRQNSPCRALACLRGGSRSIAASHPELGLKCRRSVELRRRGGAQTVNHLRAKPDK